MLQYDRLFSSYCWERSSESYRPCHNICCVIKLMDVCTCLSNGILIISVNSTRRQITVNEYFCHTVNQLLRVILNFKAVLVIYHQCRVTSLVKEVATNPLRWTVIFFHSQTCTNFVYTFMESPPRSILTFFTLECFQHQKIRMFAHSNLQNTCKMPVL